MQRELWVWAKGGLCNKWLAACAGLALSQRDDRRFVLCWPRETGAEKFITPLGAEGFLSPQASFNDLWSNDWTQVTLEDWHKLGALAVPWIESSGTAARVKARGFSFFCGKQSRHVQDVSGGPSVEIPDSSSDIEKYVKQFIPNTLVQARVDSVAPLIDAAPSVVGLAIRTVRAHPETYKRSPLSKFFEDLAAHFRQFPEAEVFISADEEKIVHMFVERFPEHKFHYQSGASEWHSVESTQKALADLYLLARTDHFISSDHSSFSGVANILRGRDAKRRQAIRARA